MMGKNNGLKKQDKFKSRFENMSSDILEYLYEADIVQIIAVDIIAGQDKTDIRISGINSDLKYISINISYKSAEAGRTSGNSVARHSLNNINAQIKFSEEELNKIYLFIHDFYNCDTNEVAKIIEKYSEEIVKFVFLGGDSRYYPHFVVFENDNLKKMISTSDIILDALSYKIIPSKNGNVIYIGKLSMQVYDRSKSQNGWDDIQFKYSFGNVQDKNRLNKRQKNKELGMTFIEPKNTEVEKRILSLGIENPRAFVNNAMSLKDGILNILKDEEKTKELIWLLENEDATKDNLSLYLMKKNEGRLPVRENDNINEFKINLVESVSKYIKENYSNKEFTITQVKSDMELKFNDHSWEKIRKNLNLMGKIEKTDPNNSKCKTWRFTHN